jgi:hypothetical protein
VKSWKTASTRRWVVDLLQTAGGTPALLENEHSLERLMREIRRRTRVLDALPDGFPQNAGLYDGGAPGVSNSYDSAL